MKRLLLPLALAATAALLWQSVSPALSCSCSYNTAPDLVARADTILIGTVEDARVLVRGVADPPGNPVVQARIGATVDVERYLKGAGPDTVAVEELGSPCGVFSPGLTGGKYLLMLVGNRSPFEVEGICSRSSLIYDIGDIYPESAGSALLLEQDQWLSEIRALTGPGVPPETNNAPTLPLAIAAVALPLVFVLAASFVFPARGSRP